MTPAESAAYLNSFIDYEHDLHQRTVKDFKLDRMFALLEAVGNPQQRLLAVHVAGSKGKGSTCAMLANILSASGYTTGLYTSPHIDSYHERIRVLGDKTGAVAGRGIFNDSIRDEDLTALIAQYKDRIEHIRRDADLGRLTFYEVFTALALLYFEQRHIDVVVLETGLGGRLDATNTVPARVAVITPVGLEHTAILGETLAAIAAEKAAIIKEGQEVVIAPQAPEADEVIEKRCAACGITARRVHPGMWEPVSAGPFDQIIHVRSPREEYRDLRLGLTGSFQRMNAVTAICAAESLSRFGITVSREGVTGGLGAGGWPLRFEYREGTPVVILDGAHSIESMYELKKALAEIFPQRRVHAVIGMSAGKNREAMCRIIGEFAHAVYLTAADHPRAHRFSLSEGQRLFPGMAVSVSDGVRAAMKSAGEAARADDLVLVTGSLYAAAEARRYGIQCGSGV